MRVLMIPTIHQFEGHESGIKRVVEAYIKYGKDYDIQFVECPIDDERAYDIFAIHAGTTDKYPKKNAIVSHLHGLYWTADYQSNPYEMKANKNVIESIRMANLVTVPSRWVADNVARDARIMPEILPHGIDYESWEYKGDHDGYVIWNKNRQYDVCNPHAVGVLAANFPNIDFVTTFAPHGFSLPNITVSGLVDNNTMKSMVHRAGVYLSSTKETFGIGILEAMASGVPVLGFDHGGNKDLVKHGVDGYLARPNDYDDLSEGLEYCLKFRKTLGANARASARDYGWNKAMEKLAKVYTIALDKHRDGIREKYLDPSLYKVN